MRATRVVLVTVWAVAWAALASAQVSIPNVFVAGTVASPSAVNANFAALGAAALNRTGGTLSGNLTVANGVTIDGVNIKVALCAACDAGFKTVTTTGAVSDSVGTMATIRAGGIGIASQAAGDLITASSSSALSRVAAVGLGQLLVSGGVSTAPKYFAAGAANYYLQTAGAGSEPTWSNGNLASVARTGMNGNATLTASSAPYQFFDPDAARVVNLPAAATGMVFVIKNFDASGFALTIKDAAAATVTTVVNGQTITVVYDGTAWQVIG